MASRWQKKLFLYFFLMLILGNIFIFYLNLRLQEKNFILAVLDVGQGDAIFIQSPSGVQVLVDVGPGEKILSELLKILSPLDKSLDAIILTNPDRDHLGGLRYLLKEYEVGMILESGTLNNSAIYTESKKEIRQKNIWNFLARKGLSLDLGEGTQIKILFPDRNVRTWSSNDGSVVAKLSYGELDILLMGDATFNTENIILAGNQKQMLKSEILKIGHHGSRFSTSTSFLKAVSPEKAFISVGAKNRYGHPHPRVFSLLTENKVEIFRTDKLGSIILKCAKINECEINK